MTVNTNLAAAYLKLSTPIRRRGFKRFMSVVNYVFPFGAAARVTMPVNGGEFAFPAGDRYWLYYLLTNTPYEPELLHLLDHLAEMPSLFLDCGANMGYWSVVMSATVPTVSIEASSESFGWLQQNRTGNSNRFQVIHAAITDGSTQFVSFSKTGHSAGRHISDSGETERIPTVTVDQLVAQTPRNATGPILVKLDVEGVEVEAFRGATATLQGNSLFLYEDHGKDQDCIPTAYLLGEGRRVCFVSEAGDVVPIRSIDDARAVKANAYTGYNFVALGDRAELSL
ncbi:FkbM family methyltransferase [Devosia sp. CAU 1758]